MRKFLSFNNFSASNPKTSDTFISVPFAIFGGVLGKVKLNIPKISEAMEASRNVFFIKPAFTLCEESHKKTKLMASPATIQPIVPQTRIGGNCFSVFVIWLNDMEFTKASVGINQQVIKNFWRIYVRNGS